MKFATKLSIALLSLSTVFSTAALADDDRDDRDDRRSAQVQAKTVNTVAAAKSAVDNTRVNITGKIVRSLGNEKYELQDNTGKIRVEIDSDDYSSAQLVGKTVTISGEVDVSRSGRKIDAKSVRTR